MANYKEKLIVSHFGHIVNEVFIETHLNGHILLYQKEISLYCNLENQVITKWED